MEEQLNPEQEKRAEEIASKLIETQQKFLSLKKEMDALLQTPEARLLITVSGFHLVVIIGDDDEIAAARTIVGAPEIVKDALSQVQKYLKHAEPNMDTSIKGYKDGRLVQTTADSRTGSKIVDIYGGD